MSSKPWRESIDLPNIKHGAMPIPMGSRVGNMLFSSGIMPADPATGIIPDDADLQVKYAFMNMDNLVRIAGGDIGDIGQISVYVTDNKLRDAVNREWLARFPDEHNRPARHTWVKALGANMQVQLQIIAVLKQ